MPLCDKAQLRRDIRAAFPGAEARRRESQALCGHILAWARYREARVVGGYIPMAREADIIPVLQDVWASGRILALPRTEEPPYMTLRIVRGMEELETGRFGIPEPSEQAEILPPEQLELLIVPLEGLSRQGVRLGKGGGYYDCLLARTRCFTLGAAMSWQWQLAIPCDPWDKPLQGAADQYGIHLF